MKNPDFPIDFVVTWVDSNDKEWKEKQKKATLEEFEVLEAPIEDADYNGEDRYREVGLFKYWFRAVELYAPWVRKIYVVTDNQIPGFLNDKNSKIRIVDHKEIIDSQFLPTFDSNTIDLNIHKIEGLSEHFVYFNDDLFINRPVQKKDFFSKDGKAIDTIGQSIIQPTENFDHNIINNVAQINNMISKKEFIKKYWKSIFNPNQGVKILGLNIVLSVFPKFTRLYDPHTAFSIRKSDMNSSINSIKNNLTGPFSKPFRSIDDYTLQYVRYFQIINGETLPRHVSFGNTSRLNNPKRVEKLLFRDKKTKIVNVNDDIEATKEDIENIIKMFEIKYGEKSKFEK
ncbi:Putative polysaccharide phosphotransferase [Latilactobacillus curvatus]|uniref:stealth family protein n=1 Tax=Latilactobacillus curvatus TaxID=28038 RepID=UPI000A1B292A|nr:stealth family protein [Latilactobacillus curvatus]SMH69118.1 Putative polysaccharide phosphotransferase [Latilactobacillus curvatus]